MLALASVRMAQLCWEGNAWCQQLPPEATLASSWSAPLLLALFSLLW